MIFFFFHFSITVKSRVYTLTFITAKFSKNNSFVHNFINQNSRHIYTPSQIINYGINLYDIQ